MNISWINPRTRKEVEFEPTTDQVESKEFLDSLSSGGFPVDPGSFFPIPPPNPAMEKICIDYIRNFSATLDFEE